MTVCKHPLLSIARYSFIQLNEMEQFGMNGLTQQHKIQTWVLSIEVLMLYSLSYGAPIKHIQETSKRTNLLLLEQVSAGLLTLVLRREPVVVASAAAVHKLNTLLTGCVKVPALDERHAWAWLLVQLAHCRDTDCILDLCIAIIELVYLCM